MKKTKNISVMSEIKLLRLVVEEILQNCKKGKDILLYSNVLNELIKTIERLIVLERRLIKEQ